MRISLKLFAFILLLSFILSCCDTKKSSTEKNIPQNIEQNYKINPDIEKLLSNQNIDIANLSLELAKIIYPEINIQKFLSIIDNMVKDIQKNIEKKPDPLYKIAVINDYLYKTKGFKYDFEDTQARKTKNQFLNGYLDTKQGSCITMPLLYLILGQKLKLPIYWIKAPDHFFCRYYLDDGSWINIETTCGGKLVPDDCYIKDFKISEQALKKGVYMKKLSYKECAADLLGISAVYYARKADMNNAINYFIRSIELYPENCMVYYFLSLIYNDLGDKVKSKEYAQKAVFFGFEKFQ